MKRTARGFALYAQITDESGAVVRVQQSSEVGKRRVWLFADLDGNGRQPDHHLGRCNPSMPYLTPSQARIIAKALLRFADGSVDGVEPRRKKLT